MGIRASQVDGVPTSGVDATAVAGRADGQRFPMFGTPVAYVLRIVPAGYDLPCPTSDAVSRPRAALLCAACLAPGTRGEEVAQSVHLVPGGQAALGQQQEPEPLVAADLHDEHAVGLQDAVHDRPRVRPGGLPGQGDAGDRSFVCWQTPTVPGHTDNPERHRGRHPRRKRQLTPTSARHTSLLRNICPRAAGCVVSIQPPGA